MKRNIKFVFRSAAQSPDPSPGMTIVIRTDARHATASLKQNLMERFEERPDLAFNSVSNQSKGDLGHRVEKALHMAYQDWGHKVLSALADCLDYKSYGLEQSEDKFVNVHFYNSDALAQEVMKKAKMLVSQMSGHNPKVPTLYVSLDDLIDGKGEENWSEIAFSRLFSLSGDQQGDYRARPGTKPIEEQMTTLYNHLHKLSLAYGEKIPIVFLEDNVRRAKMLNWVIDKMDENHVFDFGTLAGISTCFCCATPAEREAIKCHGQTVPIAAVVDYGNAKVDVATPRDLLFDGFVVQLMETTARLPAVFMDIEKLFKVQPERKDEFHELVTEANVEFCERLEQEFGVAIPLGWFSVSEAVSRVTGFSPKTPMIDVIKKAANQNPPEPDPGFHIG